MDDQNFDGSCAVRLTTGILKSSFTRRRVVGADLCVDNDLGDSGPSHYQSCPYLIVAWGFRSLLWRSLHRSQFPSCWTVFVLFLRLLPSAVLRFHVSYFWLVIWFFDFCRIHFGMPSTALCWLPMCGLLLYLTWYRQMLHRNPLLVGLSSFPLRDPYHPDGSVRVWKQC